MGNTVTVIKGDVTEVFENVLGHQVGNGAIQILERNGNQRIINAYDDISVELDEEARAKFEFDLLAMEKNAEEAANVAADAANDEDEAEAGEAEAAEPVSH